MDCTVYSVYQTETNFLIKISYLSHQHSLEQDITRDWSLIRSAATDVLEEFGITSVVRKRVPLKGNSHPIFNLYN